MANVKLLFYGDASHQCETTTIEAFANQSNGLYICIEDRNSSTFDHIVLDKDTAVKLVKELKRQISFLV